MASQPPVPARLPADTAILRRAVEAGLPVLRRDLLAAPKDEKTLALFEALLALHLEEAEIRFRAAAEPKPAARSGMEPLTPEEEGKG